MHAGRIGLVVGVMGIAVSLCTAACKKKGDSSADAAADAAPEAAAPEDAGVAAPIVEDAAVEAAAPVPTAAKTAVPAAITGLPRSCVDSKGGLGTLTFAVSGTNVTITTSKGPKATCTKKDDQLLLCDWMGADGKPTVSGRKVTYGAKRVIGGNYDTKNIFSCPPQ